MKIILIPWMGVPRSLSLIDDDGQVYLETRNLGARRMKQNPGLEHMEPQVLLNTLIIAYCIQQPPPSYTSSYILILKTHLLRHHIA